VWHDRLVKTTVTVDADARPPVTLGSMLEADEIVASGASIPASGAIA
jgi:hypothetical protein